MEDMENALLTVNVVTYNHAPYIERCLDSILNQETSFGVIVRIFDDCSTDGTTEICQKYAIAYPQKIQFFCANENLGVTLNPLRSYSDITTPYYLYIEGDDFRVDKHGFQKQVEVLEQHPECGFCYANTINLERNGKWGDVYPCLPTGIYTQEYVLNHPTVTFCSKLLTRVVRTKFIAIDATAPAYYLTDITQFFELLKCAPFYFINQTYGAYVKTGNGISTGKRLFERVEYDFIILNKYNDYSSVLYNKNLMHYFIVDMNAFYAESFVKERAVAKNTIKSVSKKILYLFFPGIITEIIRKIYRFLKVSK